MSFSPEQLRATEDNTDNKKEEDKNKNKDKKTEPTVSLLIVIFTLFVKLINNLEIHLSEAGNYSEVQEEKCYITNKFLVKGSKSRSYLATVNYRGTVNNYGCQELPLIPPV